MDPATIGRQIKAQHPEYNDMTDEEVGNRILQKQSQVSNIPKSTAEIYSQNKLPEQIGGMGGGLLGGLAAGLPGEVLGSAGGGAIGSAFNNLGANISALVRGEPQIPFNPLEALRAGAYQGGLATLGAGIGKGLGLLAHPISSLTDYVTQLVGKSPETIDMAKILSAVKETGQSTFDKRLISSEFPQAYGTVASNIERAMSALSPKQIVENIVSSFRDIPMQGAEASKAIVPEGFNFGDLPRGTSFTLPNQVTKVPILSSIPATDISTQNIPVSLANQIKRALGAQASDFYGAQGPAIAEVQKIAQNQLKNEIENKVPEVALPNKIASFLYKLEPFPKAATYAAPGGSFGIGRAARNIGPFIANVLGKALPQGGGYLNSLLPLLFQTFNPPPSSQ